MSPPSCETITAEFQSSFFNATRYPNNWKGEFVTYIFCMTTLGLSLIYCFYFTVVTRYKYDYLRLRSFSMMFISSFAALLQFHVGGYSLIQQSQLPCYFQGLGPLMILPLTGLPMMVRIITFKATFIVAQAAAKGVTFDSDTASTSILNGDDEAQHATTSLIIWRDRIIFVARVVTIPRPPKLTMDRDELAKWKFLTTNRGMVLQSCIIVFPMLLAALCVFIDPVYRTSCLGCALRTPFIILLIIIALLMIIYFNWHGYQMRGASDPFLIVNESVMGARLGGIPAIISYIIYFIIPTSDVLDIGFTNNMAVALSFLVIALVQSLVQVLIAQYRDSQELAAANITRKDKMLGIMRNHVVSPVLDGPVITSRTAAAKRYNYQFLMDQVFERPALHQSLENLLIAEHGPELLSFCDAVKAFKLQYYETSERGNVARARRILQTYIGTEATFQVNISSDQADSVWKEFNDHVTKGSKIPFEMFDESFLEITQLLKFGPIVRLVKSNAWKQLIADGAVRDEDFFATTVVTVTGSGRAMMGE